MSNRNEWNGVAYDLYGVHLLSVWNVCRVVPHSLRFSLELCDGLSIKQLYCVTAQTNSSLYNSLSPLRGPTLLFLTILPLKLKLLHFFLYKRNIGPMQPKRKKRHLFCISVNMHAFTGESEVASSNWFELLRSSSCRQCCLWQQFFTAAPQHYT